MYVTGYDTFISDFFRANDIEFEQGTLLNGLAKDPDMFFVHNPEKDFEVEYQYLRKFLSALELPPRKKRPSRNRSPKRSHIFRMILFMD